MDSNVGFLISCFVPFHVRGGGKAGAFLGIAMNCTWLTMMVYLLARAAHAGWMS